MNIRLLILFACIAGILSPDAAFAQRGSMRGRVRHPSEDNDKEEAKRSSRKARKKADSADAPPAAGGDRKSIESYLSHRLAKNAKALRARSRFGKGMYTAWGKFWQQIHDDRKEFEGRMARQRLNLFESLKSLDAAFHAQTIADFEKLQGNMIKSFERSQQEKMAQYFNQLISDLKQYQLEQESIRLEFMKTAMDSWKLQKNSVKKP